MIVSLNWLKKYVQTSENVASLVDLIGSRLVEVEEVYDLGKKYKDAVIVLTKSVKPIEGTDHLNLVKIDDGGINKELPRDDNGFIQVVCGAPNVAEGKLVVWLPPKSIVPESFSKQPFILDSRNIKGFDSHGMLASPKELDLFDDHSGLLMIDQSFSPGTSFAFAYELDDYLLDIENKSLTHRPDTFGVIGFAREVAAIQDKRFLTPDIFKDLSPDISAESPRVTLTVKIDDPDLSKRYQAIIVELSDGPKITPLIIRTYLSRVGVRPINPIVDITNYLMLLTGQPLHAFDYDKLLAVSGGKSEIHVRLAREGETMQLLDDSQIKLSTDDIVIAAGEVPVALAGAMGGASAAIDNSTKRVVIESATFNLFKLRSTQMRHGIFSEAITRFTKGQPQQLTAPVLAESVRLFNEWTGARLISGVAEDYPEKPVQKSVTVSIDAINGVLGTSLVREDIVSTLANANFEIDSKDIDRLEVAVPWWRTDINIPEDVIEEVGRLGGYDNIPTSLPMRDFTAVKPSAFDDFRKHIRDLLARAGANEVLTYNFIHGDISQKANQDIANMYRITNSLSPNLQYYRQSLTPSLLNLVHQNVKNNYDKFALFETNKAHDKSDGLNQEKVPNERELLGFVYVDAKNSGPTAYYLAKKYLNFIAERVRLQLNYKPISETSSADAMYRPFEPKRSAVVYTKSTNKVIGIIGEYKNSVTKAFKLPAHTSGFEISMSALFDAYSQTKPGYKPLSKYPSTDRDVCFRVNKAINYQQLVDELNQASDNLNFAVSVSLVDIYQKPADDMKNITVKLVFTSYQQTLDSAEVTKALDTISGAVITKFGATIV